MFCWASDLNPLELLVLIIVLIIVLRAITGGGRNTGG